MALLHENGKSYSTLERLRDDDTLRTPQALGPATTGAFDNTPELDGANSAPEGGELILPGTSPEVFYDTLPPEAIDGVEKPQDLVLGNGKSQRRGKWLLAVLGSTVVAALVIGLKIGLQKKDSPAISLKPATSSLAQQIIDDSSLAATLATNSDRHLFFQAPRGSIRRMIYTANEAQWIADPNPIAVSDAKMLTPMAVSTLTALKAVNSSEQLISDTLVLYYITTRNQLNTSLSTGRGWVPDQRLFSNYTTAPDTRQLSITSRGGTNSTESGATNGTINQSLLLYEDSGGNVAALLRVQQFCPIVKENLEDCFNKSTVYGSYWLDVTKINHSNSHSDFSPIYYNSTYDPYQHEDFAAGVIISSTLYESRPGAKFSPPFATGSSLFEKGSGLSVDLLICDDGTQGSHFSPDSPFFCSNVAYTTYRSWTNASHGFFQAQQDTRPDYNDYIGYDQSASSYLSINESDIAIIDYGNGPFAIWINETQPSLLGYNNIIPDNVAPNVSFPFKRLASINSPDRNSSYLYHQINRTTIAEEHYDYSLSQWLSTYITVPNA